MDVLLEFELRVSYSHFLWKFGLSKL